MLNATVTITCACCAFRLLILSSLLSSTAGPWKGQMGLVTGVTETQLRVELHAVMKTVSVPRTKAVAKKAMAGESEWEAPLGSQTPLIGSRTPAWSDTLGSATPGPCCRFPFFCADSDHDTHSAQRWRHDASARLRRQPHALARRFDDAVARRLESAHAQAQDAAHTRHALTCSLSFRSVRVR